MSGLEQIETAVTLRPGDRVLIAFRHAETPAGVQDLQVTLEREFPGVHFVVAANVTGLAVQRGGSE